MNNKKTFILTFFLAIILVIGIFIFSLSIQAIWQSTKESENTINFNNNTTIGEISSTYPYESITNCPSEIIPYFYHHESLLESISTKSDGMASLQEASNTTGNFINTFFTPTSLIPPTAYIDYIYYEHNNSTEIQYLTKVVYEDISFDFSATLNSLTLEFIRIDVEFNSPFPSSAILINDSDFDEFIAESIPLEQEEKIKTTTNEILTYLGYQDELINISYGYSIFLTEDKTNGKSQPLYNVDITFADNTAITLLLTADTQNPKLIYFSGKYQPLV